jgi:hypothetical protein
VTFELLAEKALSAVLARRRQTDTATAPAEPETAEATGETDEAAVLVTESVTESVLPEHPSPYDTRVLTLQSWPHMRDIPVQLLGCHARVCALLAYNPSVGYLVHRRLGLEAAEVLTVLQSLHDAGHLRVGSDEPRPAGPAPREARADTVAPSTAAPRPLWGRLLARLLG